MIQAALFDLDGTLADTALDLGAHSIPCSTATDCPKKA